MRFFIAYILIPISLVSCKTQNLFMTSKNDGTEQQDSIFRYDPDYQYHIKKDDKITVSVWNQDELSVGSVYGIYNSNEVYGKWLLVDAKGHIELPKIGTFDLLNYTIPQVKDSLKKQYQKWIVNPVIDVKVLNKEITLLGEVKNPGVIQVDKDQNNLLELISKAGGVDFYANLKSIKIIRQSEETVYMKDIDLTNSSNYLSKNITLYPGDVVVVPSKKNKEFDRRISTIVPLLSTISTAAIITRLFIK